MQSHKATGKARSIPTNILHTPQAQAQAQAQMMGLSFAHEGSLDDDALRNLLPDNNPFQTNNTRPALVTSCVFPKRLGVQGYTAEAPEGSSILIHRDVQTASQSPGMPVLPRANYGGPLTANGPPQSSVPIQNLRSMPNTGQGIPVAKVNGDPQNCEVFHRPSLKRRAIQSPPDATWVHQRKLTKNPIIPPFMSKRPISPSMPYKTVPPSVSCKPVLPESFKPKKDPAMLPTATTAHSSMPALPHIKWQGNNEQPEPTGHKCLICRRDLIFSPEGPVERPPISPPVAVLHCGHTFHDHCLQKITPEDQSKSPPCIPCAIGEN